MATEDGPKTQGEMWEEDLNDSVLGNLDPGDQDPPEDEVGSGNEDVAEGDEE